MRVRVRAPAGAAPLLRVFAAAAPSSPSPPLQPHAPLTPAGFLARTHGPPPPCMPIDIDADPDGSRTLALWLGCGYNQLMVVPPGGAGQQQQQWY